MQHYLQLQLTQHVGSLLIMGSANTNTPQAYLEQGLNTSSKSMNAA